MKHVQIGALLAVIAASLFALSSAQAIVPSEFKIVRSLDPQCSQFVGSFNSSNLPGPVLRGDVEVWQAVVLILCFGAFGLLVVLVHKLIRTYIYYDAHLLDTFFDGGGDINLALVASAIVAKWAWPFLVSQGVNDVRNVGLVGHFWFATGMSIQLFLFAIVAAEIRIKAPGAKTFLQVIKARHGAGAHVVLMIFALLVITLVTALVMTEGTRVLTQLTDDIDREVIVIMLAISVVCMTVVGGVGGTIYVAYFGTATMIIISVVFMADIFYDPLDRGDQLLGDTKLIYERVRCVDGGPDNENDSALTFLSRDGMMRGIIYILSTFGIIFVDQSYWQTGTAAKPTHSVWGFITGGLTWFAMAFVMSYALGMAYLSFSMDQGYQLVSDEQAREGLAAIVAGQRAMQDAGSYLLFTFVMIAVITTISGEVLAASSIIIYDIYQTYIAPFRATPVPESKQISMRMQRAIKNEEYLEYDKRCVVLKHVVVVSVSILTIPAALVLLAIDIDSYWLYIFTAIMVSSCVLPIALAITWHRITGAGVVTGCLGGFVIAFIAWLAIASTFDGGLERFRQNTIEDDAVIVGTACGLGFGGILCVIVSLCCGGCDSDLQEEEEWEKVREIDNPILPWSVKYAPNIGAKNMTRGRPHFYTVRRTFKASEICAYIFGVLLAVGFVLVWPALMLTADVFGEDAFEAWSLAVLIIGIIAMLYIVLVPLLWEIINSCRQAYYNRMWSRTDNRQRLEEETPTPEPSIKDHPRAPTPPPVDTHSDASTMDRDSRQRWKTFISIN